MICEGYRAVKNTGVCLLPPCLSHSGSGAQEPWAFLGKVVLTVGNPCRSQA